MGIIQRHCYFQGRYAVVISIAISILMLLGKSWAYILTASTAIFSEAVESIVHLFITVISAVCFWYSRQPPDKEHPYGHGKIVYFSAAWEGLLILFAGVTIVVAPVDGI